MRVYFSTQPGSDEWLSSDKIDQKWIKFTARETGARNPSDGILLCFADPANNCFLNYLRGISNPSNAIIVTKKELLLTDALSLFELGFRDIITWRGIESFEEVISARLMRIHRILEILDSELVRKNLIGASKKWRDFLYSVIETSLFSNSNAIILGESGTGKELVSRLIHSTDEARKAHKLILLDCSTISPELSGSEFFGHERGSYTSAITTREGAFALANKGTLFLDEIGELPMRMQAELLRVVQEGKYKKVGSNTWQTTSFRLISATNRNLKEMIQENLFRSDLYFRISDVELHVPPLRERIEDIRLLSVHFLNEFFKENRSGEDIPQFALCVSQWLASRSYYGNVRELRQLIRRIAMRFSGGGFITLGDVPPEDRSISVLAPVDNEAGMDWEQLIRQNVAKGGSLFDIKNSAAFTAIKVALELEQGNRQKAADRLNITTRAIQQYFKKSRNN